MALTESPSRPLIDLATRFDEVRATTEALAAPLAPEDQVIQSMPDVSPTKWHRAHTTWFFETFVLGPHLTGYSAVHPGYDYLFNSYYEQVGPRHPRAERGLISRPTVAEVGAYRASVDDAVRHLLHTSDPTRAEAVRPLVEMGLHHEQQHQELLLMDIKHVLSCNPLRPAYDVAPLTEQAGAGASAGEGTSAGAGPAGWVEVGGGLEQIGHDGIGDDFAFDSETPRHRTFLEPFRVADRLVTCGEWLAFLDDGGYRRPELWLSDGWATVSQQGWRAPLYWRNEGDGWPSDAWSVFTLHGMQPVDPAEPVAHVSFFEADAFASWAGARLPTEAEWEVAAAAHVGDDTPNDLATGALHPQAAVPRPGLRQAFGDVWEWTASPYRPYPGFRPAAGAIGEYNGKFMCNQMVLRGGACTTPAGHTRPTYRNFFPPAARWAFSGLRLAADA